MVKHPNTILRLEEYSCPLHGEYQGIPLVRDREVVVPPCPKCKVENNSFQKSESSESIGKLLEGSELWQRVRNAGVPERYISKSFDDYQVDNNTQKKLLDICMKYVERFKVIRSKGHGLGFIGDFGTGKTLLASCIAISLIRSHYKVIFTDQAGMVMHIDDEKRAHRREKEALNRFVSADLLVIDEMGRGASASADGALLVQNVLSYRYDRNLPSILIGNFSSKDEFTTYLSSRVTLRLQENGFSLTECDWPPKRQVTNNTDLFK